MHVCVFLLFLLAGLLSVIVTTIGDIYLFLSIIIELSAPY